MEDLRGKVRGVCMCQWKRSAPTVSSHRLQKGTQSQWRHLETRIGSKSSNPSWQNLSWEVEPLMPSLMPISAKLLVIWLKNRSGKWPRIWEFSNMTSITWPIRLKARFKCQSKSTGCKNTMRKTENMLYGRLKIRRILRNPTSCQRLIWRSAGTGTSTRSMSIWRISSLRIYSSATRRGASRCSLTFSSQQSMRQLHWSMKSSNSGLSKRSSERHARKNLVPRLCLNWMFRLLT